MALEGYRPITTLGVICNALRNGLNQIDAGRKFTVRSIDTTWEEFVENSGWSKNGSVTGGIVWVRIREGGEKFTDGPTHGVDVSTTYLVRCAIPSFKQRNRGGADGQEQFLGDFEDKVMAKIVEIGVTNQTWFDDQGNPLSNDCTVKRGGMFTSKKEATPLFIFEYYYVVQNTIKYDLTSVA